MRNNEGDEGVERGIDRVERERGRCNERKREPREREARGERKGNRVKKRERDRGEGDDEQ